MKNSFLGFKKLEENRYYTIKRYAYMDNGVEINIPVYFFSIINLRRMYGNKITTDLAITQNYNFTNYLETNVCVYTDEHPLLSREIEFILIKLDLVNDINQLNAIFTAIPKRKELLYNGKETILNVHIAIPNSAIGLFGRFKYNPIDSFIDSKFKTPAENYIVYNNPIYKNIDLLKKYIDYIK